MKSDRLLILSGAESTGKTTLAQYLSDDLDIPWMEEMVRYYDKSTNIPFTIHHLYDLYIKYMASIRHLLSYNKDLIIDTDPLTLKIWANVKFDYDFDISHCLSLYKDKSVKYVVTYPDVRWVADGMREDPHNRITIHNQYVAALEELSMPYVVVSGSYIQRTQDVLNIAKPFFSING